MVERHFTRRAILLLALFMCTAGCSRGVKDLTGAAGKAKDFYTIGMSQCNLGEPWRVQMNADLKAAADKYPNIEIVFKDAQNDTLKQRAHVEEFVSAGVDLLIISPKEAAPLTEPVAKAVDAGIPVIVLDRAVQGDKYTCFIGADNNLIG
jgi:ribose transport system substrate-binding protein